MLKNKLVFNEAARLMEQIREYIDCHYMENLTAAALGNEIGISQGYLSQLIKKETGKTYSELIQQKKLEKAKELLQYSENTRAFLYSARSSSALSHSRSSIYFPFCDSA